MRKLATAAVSTLLGGLSLFAPVAAPALAATNPKVAIIVGATHDVTPSYRNDANEVYAEAIKYTNNVVKVYSPGATWAKVQAAVAGASIVVYLGHGNGWPSPYTFDPQYTTKDGFGLNSDLNGDGKLTDFENKYYGEPKIATLKFAPNAVVLLFHLCYASGNSEPGNANPSLSTARQRVDNYAAAFLKAGARAVIANGHSHDPYYIRALFTTRQSIDAYWRGAPDFHNHVSAYASGRSPGYTYQMDPEGSGKYYRSIAGKMSLSTVDVTGASYASTVRRSRLDGRAGQRQPRRGRHAGLRQRRGRRGRHDPERHRGLGRQGARRGARDHAHEHRSGDLPRPRRRRRDGLDDGRRPRAARLRGTAGLGDRRRGRRVLAQRRRRPGRAADRRAPQRVGRLDDAGRGRRRRHARDAGAARATWRR